MRCPTLIALSQQGHAFTQSRCQLLNRAATGKPENPVRTFPLCGRHVKAVEKQEEAQRTQSGSLVAIDEKLSFCDAMGQGRCLSWQVGTVVVGLPEWASECSLQTAEAPQVVPSDIDGDAEDLRMYQQDIIHAQVGDLVPLLLHASVRRLRLVEGTLAVIVGGEDVEGFAILLDHVLCQVSHAGLQVLGRADEDLPGWQRLDKDALTWGVPEPLELTRQDHDVAIAEPTHLEDLHEHMISKDIF